MIIDQLLCSRLLKDQYQYIILSEKSAKNMEYAAEKKKFDQMEKCRAQIENYQSRRHVAERNMGRKKGELE